MVFIFANRLTTMNSNEKFEKMRMRTHRCHFISKSINVVTRNFIQSLNIKPLYNISTHNSLFPINFGYFHAMIIAFHLVSGSKGSYYGHLCVLHQTITTLNFIYIYLIMKYFGGHVLFKRHIVYPTR